MVYRRFVIPLALLLGATAAVWSCRNAAPVGVDARTTVLLAGRHPQPPGGDDGDDDGDESEDGDSLVTCRPLRYDSVTKTIGPEGGAIEVRHNWLVVPTGALSGQVAITAVAPSDSLALVRFQPEGLTFQKTAFLVAAYDNCRVPKDVTPRIALVTDALDVIEYLAPTDAVFDDHRFKKAPRRHVIGELHHFSNYAVAW